MTILEIVEDAISNAYYNGYNAEIESLSDEELAWDLILLTLVYLKRVSM